RKHDDRRAATVGHFAGPLHQLETTQARKLVINQDDVVSVIAGELPEGAVTVFAKLNQPFLSGEHINYLLGDERVVLNMQHREFCRRRSGTSLCELLRLSWLEQKVLSSFSHHGPCLEQILVPALYQ